MDELIGLQVHAEARVERGTAEFCACGGLIRPLYLRGTTQWTCLNCGKEYE